MALLKQNFSKWSLLGQGLFVYVWMTVLKDSDSRVGIYVLCAMAAVLILFDRYRSLDRIGVDREKGSVSVEILSGLFSLAVLLANYPIFLEVRDATRVDSDSNAMVNAVRCCAVFIGGFFVGRNIISCVLAHFPREVSGENRTREKARKVFWGAFLVLVFVYGGYFFLTEYPGNITSDSLTQIRHGLSNRYDTMHPFWHSMVIKVCLVVGNGLFGDLNAGVACYSVVQILAMAGCIAYLIMTLYEAGIPGWCVGVSLAGYAVVPYHIALSITLWKDIPHSLGILLLVTALFRRLRSLGSCPVRETVLMAVGGLLVGLMRTNGVVTLGIFLVIMARFLWKLDRRILSLLGMVFLVCVVLCGPVMGLFDTYEHSFAFLETFSVPIQQVARVIAEGGELTPDQLALVDRMVDSQKIGEIYTPESVDSVKHTMYLSDPGFFLENKAQYGKLWVDLGMKYPMEYLKAWVDVTKGFWNGGYRFRQYSEGILGNDLGLEKTVVSGLLLKLKNLWFGFVRFTVVADVINSIGLQVWVMILGWFVNLKNRKAEAWLFVPYVVILLGLWLGTPVFAEFRYAYPLILTLPLLIAMSFFNTGNAGREMK